MNLPTGGIQGSASEKKTIKLTLNDIILRLERLNSITEKRKLEIRQDQVRLRSLD